MIVPMRKYAFLVYHAEYTTFLEGIRKLGVVDVVQRTREYDSATMDKLLMLKQVADTIKILKKRNAKPAAAETDAPDGLQLVERVRALLQEEEQNLQSQATISKEINNLSPWGDFSKDTIQKLQKAGLKISFFITSIKKYNPEWERTYNIGIVNTISPDVYFIVVREGDEEIDIDAEEIRMPERTLSELEKRKVEIDIRLQVIRDELDHIATSQLGSLEITKQSIFLETEFDKVIANTRPQLDDSVMLLEGFVPVPREADLSEFCEHQNIVFLSDRPEPEDKVPVLLQNSKFSKLFEPISKLFSLPSYAELDLTPLFAPFFMMFFGFCLGDAGYGLLVLLGATLYKRKAKESFRPYLTLAQYLGGATIIFGIVSGTLFGINLIEAKIPALESVRGYFFDSQKMFYLALIMGAVQIIFGMFVKVFNVTRQQGFAYAISTIGWIVLIVGMMVRMLLLKLKVLPEDDQILLYAILGVSGVMILLLNDPKANVFVRMGKGVWDVYGMVTGIFGDLLSYIRLFALGISSAILGLVINSIGMNMLGVPYIGPILFVLFLAVGHLANILISSLGSFVHPMRLTFVEFYKNAGFTGGGKAYKPFSENSRN